MEQTYSTGDLRGDAVAYQRHHAQKHKWAAGVATYAPGRRQPIIPGTRRPIHPQQRVNSAIRRGNAKLLQGVSHRMNMTRKFDILEEQCQTDSSDDDVVEASAAPEPDAEIAYSYDAERGPQQGSQILSMALTKAVEKFHTKETEKLIKEEYEVVGKEPEAAENMAGPATTDADGFELI
ncbi:hypothetical protein L228DRAFT_168605 [Xylona heveae TC161]|uniref:Uncharacterized protein n=1 Tax=Xylona heveae (strain CBS 132557 / TC161) TaxID=1328760 RepID=A0A165FPN2_XYLHT|nr:hypothetical protein L228DRAFT_168605 [Xylona heveae TC161]KZF21232.1 hypothetical protein L228DRAFT_168605 [Xylona heveae TC161]